MQLTNRLQGLRKSGQLIKSRLKNRVKRNFTCLICGYRGPFEDMNPPTGLRKHAKCPTCGSLERHRIQYLLVSRLLKKINAASLRMIHFAPEEFFCEMLAKSFGQYETADLDMKGVEHIVDLQDLPFRDKTYDFVFASHVLEHIRDDNKAIHEIRRILKPNGIANLPVPVVADKTVEYPEPNLNESYHVRAPGLDYFDRYERAFSV